MYFKKYTEVISALTNEIFFLGMKNMTTTATRMH